MQELCFFVSLSLSLSMLYASFATHLPTWALATTLTKKTPGITLLWAKALGFAMVHGFALLMGVTLLLPPAPMLRALVEEEVSTFTFLGRSNVAVIICDSVGKISGW